MIELRSNQKLPIRKAREFFQQKKSLPSLMVLPTAWGKSILVGWVAHELKEKILVIQPSKELLEQNFNKYFDLCGTLNNVGIYSASFDTRILSDVTFVTIGSVKKMGEELKNLGYKNVLIDEAHMYPREDTGMLMKFIKDLKPKHVLGVTATPFKLQTNTDMNGMEFSKLVCLTNRGKTKTFFKKIIHVSQIQEMVRLNYWSPLRYEYEDINETFLEYNSTRADFTDLSVEKTIKENNIIERIEKAVNLCEKEYKRSHILVFVPSIELAIQMQKKMGGGVVYSGMKDSERKDVITAFCEGRLNKLFNVRILSVGFDYPGIDGIILGYATASLTNYYQIIGRGTRIHPLKKDCIVYDLGGNYLRFGKVEDLRMTDATGQWEMVNRKKLVTSVPIHMINFPYTMPFGAYKGMELEKAPDSYLNWILNNIKDLSPVLQKQIRFILWERENPLESEFETKSK